MRFNTLGEEMIGHYSVMAEQNKRANYNYLGKYLPNGAEWDQV